MVRISALVLALATVLPWYTSKALVDQDRYIGNPFPLVDWLVAGLAVVAIALPRKAKAAAVAGCISVGLTVLAYFVDSAEGLTATIEYGLVLAGLSSAALWFNARRLGRPQEQSG